ANKLYDAVKKEGEKWKADAARASSDPIKAYDLYEKVATVFADDELGKSVEEPMKKLLSNPAVSKELAARKAFASVHAMIARSRPAQKKTVADFCRDIAQKHGGTPTGDKAKALAKEIGS